LASSYFSSDGSRNPLTPGHRGRVCYNGKPVCVRVALPDTDGRGKQKGREVTGAGNDAVRRDANDGNSRARRFATSNPH